MAVAGRADLALPVAAGLGWLVLVLLRSSRCAGGRGAAGKWSIANWRSVSGPAWLLAGTLIHRVLRVSSAYAVVAAALLFSGHFDRADSQRNLAGVAGRAVVAAPRSHARACLADSPAPARSCCWASGF